MIIHPLAEDFTQLKDLEIENKIQELNKKYFQTNNPYLKQQIAIFIDLYKAEIQHRRQKDLKKQYDSRNKDLDNLIKIN